VKVCGNELPVNERNCGVKAPPAPKSVSETASDGIIWCGVNMKLADATPTVAVLGPVSA
jgi:hypothetical protein